MRVDVSPRRVPVVPGEPVVVPVHVANTSSVIAAFQVQVLGVDPRWVRVDKEQLSLFPDDRGTLEVTVTFPPGIPAGVRRVALHVVELTPPAATEVVEVDLVVAADAHGRIELDPVSMVGGRTVSAGVIVTNDGNAELSVELSGVDPEEQIDFTFTPPVVQLRPGERATVSARLKARRPLAGTPKARTFTVQALGAGAPDALGTWVQRPLLSRGALGLVGLLAAVSVFAAVITATLGQVVDKSAADRELLLDVIQAGQRDGALGDPGAISGTVTLLTSGAGVSGVTVEVFAADDPTTSLASEATGEDGRYQVDDLEPGDYKVRYRGAGFTDLWYPQAVTALDSGDVTVEPGEATSGIDVRLGGVPATIEGAVVGEDPEGATVSVRVPAPAIGAPSDAVVDSAVVDATGAFVLADVPSPSTYELVVEKEGFATETQVVTLAAGEHRTGIEILLREGDGSISGRILAGDEPLGGATITATDGTSSVSTVSLTRDDVGAFTLRDLPTPGSYTLVVAKDGFATETVNLALGEAQQLTDVAISLGGGSGSIEGRVSVAGVGAAGGVTVQVTDGEVTLTTVTLSTGQVGTYRVTGLPVPSTYTVTFSRADLAPQTVSVDLDPLGVNDAAGVDATLQPATATVSGTVSDENGPLGGAEVVLTAGDRTFRTRSASAPVAGEYEVANLPPGTYSISFSRPGSEPETRLVTLAAGQRLQVDATLEPRASITGLVQFANADDSVAPLNGAEVRLYRLATYPQDPLTVVQTGADGRYTLGDLGAPETYVLEYAFPSGTAGQQSHTVTLTPGQAYEAPTVTLDVGSSP